MEYKHSRNINPGAKDSQNTSMKKAEVETGHMLSPSVKEALGLRNSLTGQRELCCHGSHSPHICRDAMNPMTWKYHPEPCLGQAIAVVTVTERRAQSPQSTGTTDNVAQPTQVTRDLHVSQPLQVSTVTEELKETRRIWSVEGRHVGNWGWRRNVGNRWVQGGIYDDEGWERNVGDSGAEGKREVCRKLKTWGRCLRLWGAEEGV